MLRAQLVNAQQKFYDILRKYFEDETIAFEIARFIVGSMPTYTKIENAHDGDIDTCMISHNGEWFLSVGDDGKMKMWNVETGNCMHVWSGYEEVMVCISQNDRWIFSVEYFDENCETNRPIQMLNVENGNCIQTFPTEKLVEEFCIFDNDKFLASSDENGCVEIWNIENGKCVKTLQINQVQVDCFCISHNDEWIVAECFESKTINFWEIETGKCIKTLPIGDKNIDCFYLSRDDKFIFSLGAFEDETVTIWDLENENNYIKTWPRLYKGWDNDAVCLSDDDEWIICCNQREKFEQMTIWNTENKNCVQTFDICEMTIRCVCISPDKKWILTAEVDGTLTIFPVGTTYNFRHFVTLEQYQNIGFLKHKFFCIEHIEDDKFHQKNLKIYLLDMLSN